MNILYIDYNMIGKNDIIEAFVKLGNKVKVVDYPLAFGDNSEEFRKALYNELDNSLFDIVFTSNYYPLVSEVCNSLGVTYLSWTYDSPRIALYDKSINNSVNYAFVFDGHECSNLKSMGVDRVYYMPLAANTDRIRSLKITEEDRNVFEADVSFVASLYNEEHNLYDRLYERLDNYTRGYLDAVLQAQKNIYGGCIIEESLDDIIVNNMYKAMPYPIANGSLASLRYVYGNYFVARKAATLQRIEFMNRVSAGYNTKIYSGGDLSFYPNINHMGTVDYYTDMYKVFKLSKINMNVTLPSICSGIPLRVIDIMGAGGFVLTDYRENFDGLFEAGTDYVYYTSIDDAINKIDHYLKNEDERCMIARSGQKKVEENCTYIISIQKMLDIIAADKEVVWE